VTTSGDSGQTGGIDVDELVRRLERLKPAARVGAQVACDVLRPALAASGDPRARAAFFALDAACRIGRGTQRKRR